MALGKTKLYAPLSDIQLVSRVLGTSHDNDAALYLIYVRHYDLLKKIFFSVFPEQKNTKKDGDGFQHSTRWVNISDLDSSEFDDALSELYSQLLGENGDWSNLGKFTSTKGNFKSWISKVAKNTFLDFRFSLYPMEKSEDGSYIPKNRSIDDMQDSEYIDCCVSFDYDPKAREYELLRRQALLIDAVNRLPDEQKIVVLGRLADKSSKDIAKDINYFRKTRGIIKRNNSGAIAVASGSSVDVIYKRAKESLKDMLEDII